mgnify:CR=1 FL=1
MLEREFSLLNLTRFFEIKKSCHALHHGHHGSTASIQDDRLFYRNKLSVFTPLSASAPFKDVVYDICEKAQLNGMKAKVCKLFYNKQIGRRSEKVKLESCSQ